ncbi:MAG: hypothetical protein FWE85_03180 [Clostridiales bacterium]|nr:hypothetical protein [Clostridiales bacterium]
MKKLLTAILILALLPLASACRERGPNFGELETVKYAHETGYEITLPASWQMERDDPRAVCFLSEDGGVAVNIVTELGGFGFYALPELVTMFLESESLTSNISGLKRDSVPPVSDKKTQYRQVLSGKLPEGDDVYLDVFIYAPMNSVRYYVVFSAGKEDYALNSNLFTQIIKSFELNKTKDEIYSLMNTS